MQTKQVIETIRWIENLFDPETRATLFGGEFTSDRMDVGKDFLSRFIAATHELARAGAAICGNPQAIRLLKAYELEHLLDHDFTTNLALAASRGGRDNKDIHKLLEKIEQPWRAMTSSIGPLESLTSPQELLNSLVEQNIVSLEMKFRRPQLPSLTDLSKVTDLLQHAYSAVAFILKKPTTAELQIVKVDSGDDAIRIDCLGDSSLVPQLRDFVSQAWHKIRNKRVDELLTKDKSVLATLPVMSVLADREKEKSIEPKVADQLRKKLLGATLGMFAWNAVLADMARHDVDEAVELANYLS